MSNINNQLLLFFLQIFILFFLSRKTINNLFSFFRIFRNNEKLIFSLISLIFFPGTIIHELSHFFAAIILFLNVYNLQIFPRFQGNEIKLGQVIYEKRDFLRSFLVWIAPIFAGIFFLFFLSFFKLFPSNNIWTNLFFGYLVFAVSSTMFSSKRDLVDSIYLIPTILIFMAIFYLFDIKLDFVFKDKNFTSYLFYFLEKINFYLLLSLLINLFVYLTLLVLQKIFKKTV